MPELVTFQQALERAIEPRHTLLGIDSAGLAKMTYFLTALCLTRLILRDYPPPLAVHLVL